MESTNRQTRRAKEAFGLLSLLLFLLSSTATNGEADLAPASRFTRAAQAQSVTRGRQHRLLQAIMPFGKGISGAMLGPAAGDSPQESIARYQKLLASDPGEPTVMKALARAQAEASDFQAAIGTYRKLLETDPADYEAKLGLARVLSWNHQYDESIRLYREILASTPDDLEALEGLAHVYTWSGHSQDAIQAYRRLLTGDPSNRNYQLELARLQFDEKDYSAARVTLNSLLSAHPENREAQSLLARLEIRESHFEAALKQFNQLLEHFPDDLDARFGKAQVLYYLGHMDEALTISSSIVSQHPDNYDAVVLLASIERALGKRRQALEQLATADRLSPNNPEVASMRDGLENESKMTLHTTASYAREIGQPGTVASAGFEGEDLRTFDYGTTIDMSWLPRSESYFSMNYVPSNVPAGFYGGAVGPAEFLYRQTTEVSSLVALQGGVGLVRFGPGALVNLPGSASPQPSATVRPIGFVGGTFAPRKKTSFNLTWSRSSVLATPLSVRLGVIESRLTGSASFSITSRTELNLEVYGLKDSSVSYDHVAIAGNSTSTGNLIVHGPESVQGGGGSIAFDQRLIRSDRFSFEVGYSGQIYGYDSRRGAFLGFFSPAFYQQHLLTTRLAGKVRGPLGYAFTSGFGLQQVNHNAPFTPALIVGPTLDWKVNPRLDLSLGYTYYNVAQAAGVVRGNAIQLSSNWRF